MLFIGTCSWKYDSWENLVYSPGSSNDMLRQYATKFNTVEVDQWFWSLFPGTAPVLPKQKDVIHYGSSVPDDFKFTIKIPNSITLTHYYKKGPAEPDLNPHFFSPELLEQFLHTLNPIKHLLGPLMFQFEYLNRQKCANVDEFLQRFEAFAETFPAGYKFALETRNPHYLTTRFFKSLNKRSITPVFLQGYYMPPVWEIFEKHHRLIEDRIVIRLHGPDRKGIEETTGSIWNKIVEPRDEELKRIAEWIEFFIKKEVDIYVNVNNHFEGSAPLTIAKLQKLLSGTNKINGEVNN